MTPRKTYHHGDLRNALLAAALALVEEDGLEGLSLRKVAARVGVSHAAPEHHFPTMRHLMNAIAISGFEMFTRSMAEERAQALPTPIEQMRAAGRGYLAYARRHPGLFRLMFTANLLDWTDRVLQQQAELGYRQLEEICAPAADFLGLRTAAERRSLASLVWSEVHGRAHLIIDQNLPDADDAYRSFTDKPLDIVGLIFGVHRA